MKPREKRKMTEPGLGQSAAVEPTDSTPPNRAPAPSGPPSAAGTGSGAPPSARHTRSIGSAAPAPAPLSSLPPPASAPDRSGRIDDRLEVDDRGRPAALREDTFFETPRPPKASSPPRPSGNPPRGARPSTRPPRLSKPVSQRPPPPVGTGMGAASAASATGSRPKAQRTSIRVDDVGDAVRDVADAVGVASRQVPKLIRTKAEIAEAPIDHRAGFLLAHIDGITTVQGLVDIAGMPEDEVHEILDRLRRLGIVALR